MAVLSFLFGVMVRVVGLVVKRVVESVALLSGRRPWKVGADKKVEAMVVDGGRVVRMKMRLI